MDANPEFHIFSWVTKYYDFFPTIWKNRKIMLSSWAIKKHRLWVRAYWPRILYRKGWVKVRGGGPGAGLAGQGAHRRPCVHRVVCATTSRQLPEVSATTPPAPQRVLDKRNFGSTDAERVQSPPSQWAMPPTPFFACYSYLCFLRVIKVANHYYYWFLFICQVLC